MVTVRGTHLTTAGSVTFGGDEGTDVHVVSPTELTVTTPAHVAGSVPIGVTTPGGSAVSTTTFTFVVPPPTITGFTALRIRAG